jgi:hypothetical protein
MFVTVYGYTFPQRKCVSVSDSEDIPYSTSRHECEQCPKTYTRRCHWLDHVRKEYSGEPMRWSCKLCGNIYKQNGHFLQHVRRVHSGKKNMWPCPRCVQRRSMCSDIKISTFHRTPSICVSQLWQTVGFSFVTWSVHFDYPRSEWMTLPVRVDTHNPQRSLSASHGEYHLEVPLRVLVESTSRISPTHYPRWHPRKSQTGF